MGDDILHVIRRLLIVTDTHSDPLIPLTETDVINVPIKFFKTFINAFVTKF